MSIQSVSNPPEQRTAPREISPGDLPWAVVTMPTTSSGHSGIGTNRHGLKTDTWVCGFFADGGSCQIPIITGVLPRGPGGAAAAHNEIPQTGESTTAVSQVSLVGNNNTQKAFNFFLNRRFSPEQSAGILGCLYKESNLNTEAFNPAGGGRGAYGIAQWRGARLNSLEKYAEASGGSKNSLQTQLEFIMEELLKTESISYRLLQNTKNPMDSCIAFAHFERGEDYSGACFRATGNGCPADPILSRQYNTNRRILLDRIKFANSIYETSMKNDTALGIA
jgi:hypothetical protein